MADKAVSEPVGKPVGEPTIEASSAEEPVTVIGGIGPVIAKKLEALGITTIKQIAELTEADVERIDAELNFKGRIGRENWIEQAKQML